MIQARSFALLLGMFALGACAARPPEGPAAVLAVPPAGKDLGQFQREDIACRGYGLRQIGYGTSEPAAPGAATGGEGEAIAAGTDSQIAAQQGYDIAYAQCMAASGNQVQAFPVAWLYGPYGYPYVYPVFYGPWFGQIVALGSLRRVRPGFHHNFVHHGFHRG